jgi:hypothetical protein
MNEPITIWNPGVWHGRKYRRYQLECPVRIIAKSDGLSDEFETISKNIGVGGLVVRSVSQLPEGAFVTFVISLHGEGGVRPIHLVGEGEVVRVEPNGSVGVYSIALRCTVPITELEQFIAV